MNNIEMIMIVYIFLILYNGDKEKEIYIIYELSEEFFVGRSYRSKPV